jgi:hypothetical protein
MFVCLFNASQRVSLWLVHLLHVIKQAARRVHMAVGDGKVRVGVTPVLYTPSLQHHVLV